VLAPCSPTSTTLSNSTKPRSQRNHKMKHRTKRWPRWVETDTPYTLHNETAKRRIEHIQRCASRKTSRTSYIPDSHHTSQPTTDKALPTNLGRIHRPLKGSRGSASLRRGNVIYSEVRTELRALRHSSRQTETRTQASKDEKTGRNKHAITRVCTSSTIFQQQCGL
jgi:hypothetical protein